MRERAYLAPGLSSTLAEHFASPAAPTQLVSPTHIHQASARFNSTNDTEEVEGDKRGKRRDPALSLSVEMTGIIEGMQFCGSM